MKEDIGSTKERPVLRSPRRRQGETSHGQISERDSQSRPRSAANARNAKPRRSNAQHTASTKSARDGRHAANPQRKKGRPPRRRSGVPVVVVILLVIITGVASVLITRAVLSPQITTAQREAESAKSQISTLTKQLEKMSGTSKQGDSSGSNSSDSTSANDSSSSTDSKKSTTEGVEDPWVESGTYTSGDAVLDGEVKAFCDSIADKSSMDQDTALLEVYKAIAWSDYVERDSAQQPSGKNWRTEFARMYYENNCSGNCYEFASFLSFCLQYLGLSDATSEGVLVQLQEGGWGDHGIVFVTNTDGSKCICDTARGVNAWMIPESSYNVQIQDFENA